MNKSKTTQTELLPGNLLEPGAQDCYLERSAIVNELPGRAEAGILLSAVKPGPRMKSSAGLLLAGVPVNQELTFSCKLRGTRCGQQANLNIFAYDDGGNTLMESISLVSMDHKGWTNFETNFVAPTKTVRLNIFVISFAAQPAYFTRPSLRAGVASHSPTNRSNEYKTKDHRHDTKVIEARYQVPVRSHGLKDQGTVTFPIPGPYRGQVPLSFNLSAKPKDALLGYEIKQREDGTNWIAEVAVKPTSKGAILSWKSLVLIKGVQEENLPQSTTDSSQTSASWLRSTKCVQCDDEEIRAKAHELSKTATNIEAYVRSVLYFTSNNRGTGKTFDSLDAKTSIGAGGSCTSRANLAAALLRANGIPARTVAHLPAWMRSYFFEHWLVEYWHPGIGWVWIEPTLNKVQPPSNELVVLAVSSTVDEDRCDDPIHLRYFMPGAAYLSGCELSDELVIAEIMKQPAAPNIAIEQAVILGSNTDMNSLFEAAHQNFEKIKQQKNSNDQSPAITAAILAAAYDGDAKLLSQLLVNL